ncbi:HAD family hydrolase [Psychroserpens sp.]|uniref:HAD family hydrolase n=1 Tax=Psychroserpens sp. TaxID=2020870 RepID=UPI001B2BAB1F|nr:HAD family hydrolase [Psychroserpens sp.]MBO6606859.1 HAD family hydrolase [Psychroserpens sp.]MBO6654005.1 HAD family hydrolase [Psychroserpens sp.]MBO6682709.1 HAD family hydrolase [Psychroserpens sp.]MBO6750631.1 HAD family hydrolase [Psychroserpens sp.]MBO6915940.1 HAD family hydrolase [Psychroserpens sp.]
MSKYKCIIFDCDGVLVDSEPIGNQVLVDMANALGANINLEYAYKHFKGNSMQACADMIAELITQPFPKDFIAQYRKESFDAFRRNIKPVEGIVDVIQNLDISFCVASSGPENKIRLNLELTGLLNFFENKIFSCYHIQKWKPDPSVFLWAAETMGYEPNECLVVEDSPIGVMAAKSGGFTVAGYAAHDYRNELGDMVDYKLLEMQEINAIIKG